MLQKLQPHNGMQQLRYGTRRELSHHVTYNIVYGTWDEVLYQNQALAINFKAFDLWWDYYLRQILHRAQYRYGNSQITLSFPSKAEAQETEHQMPYAASTTLSNSTSNKVGCYFQNSQAVSICTQCSPFTRIAQISWSMRDEGAQAQNNWNRLGY